MNTAELEPGHCTCKMSLAEQYSIYATLVCLTTRQKEKTMIRTWCSTAIHIINTLTNQPKDGALRPGISKALQNKIIVRR